MPGPKTYTGGCHCGEVRFEVTTDLGKVTACNCSICQKRGALWSFVPAESFALRAGEEALKDYQFGKKIHPSPVLPAVRGRRVFARNQSAG